MLCSVMQEWKLNVVLRTEATAKSHGMRQVTGVWHSNSHSNSLFPPVIATGYVPRKIRDRSPVIAFLIVSIGLLGGC